MENQFVSYEIALVLKKLGFNESCFGEYVRPENPELEIYQDNDYDTYYDKPKSICLAPLWQQVIDWLKEKHGIFVFIDMGKYYDSYEGAYPFQAWCKVYKNRKLIHSVTVRNKLDNENFIDFIFYSYEEAREQAILKAIELIKIKTKRTHTDS